MRRIEQIVKRITTEPLHGVEFYTPRMYEQIIQKLHSVLENELKGIEEDTDVKKILRINDYVKNNIILNTSYIDALTNNKPIAADQFKYRTAATAIIEGQAICIGTTELTRILLEYVGIKSTTNLAMLPDLRPGHEGEFKKFFHYLVVAECKMYDNKTRKVVIDTERQGTIERRGQDFSRYMEEIFVVLEPPIEFINNKVGFNGVGEECSNIHNIKKASIKEAGILLVTDIEKIQLAQDIVKLIYTKRATIEQIRIMGEYYGVNIEDVLNSLEMDER